MQISNYITDLLYRYDCVIIPDFGAFISKRIPAQIDNEKQVIVPPRKQLSFNEQITNNDGLLTNYIASKEEIDFDSANKSLQAFVFDLKKEISERSSFTFPKIGSFSSNPEGSLVFNPNEEVNYLKEAFGLGIVETKEVVREEEEAVVVSDVDEVVPTSMVLTETKGFDYSKGAKYAASVALFIGIGGYLFWNQYKTAKADQYTETSRLVQERIQEASFAIDIKNPLPSITLNVAKESPKALEKPFHVIAGAFREKANATKLISNLTNKGFEATYLGTNKFGLHQVAYQSFSGKVEAVRFLSKIKREENKSAWILTQ